jgi:tetratricopeptide (TPR) repeat protein/S1-C subfamily serine protease
MRSNFSSLSLCGVLILGGSVLATIAQPAEAILIGQTNNQPQVSMQTVDRIAQAVTVRIDSQASGNGSGVIIAKNGSTYTVLTAEHVIGSPDRYELVTPDGQRHALKPTDIKALPGLDIATIQFTSPNPYEVAALANYDISTEDRPLAFLSGFPGTDDDTVPTRQLTVGTVFPTSVTLFAAQNAYSFASGRELVYTSQSQPGMSGGPIFDRLGRVIGIHNASETQLEADNGGSVFAINTGRSLGVPIRSFLGSASPLTQSVQVVRGAAPAPLPQTQIKQVLDQVQVKPPEAGVATDWLRYANHLWRLQRYSEAVEATKQALKLEPTLHQAHYVQGLALEAQEQYALALSAFQAATKLEPRFYEGWREQAETLQNLKQNQAALRAIQTALSIQATDPSLYLVQGDIQRSLNLLSEAQQSYDRALALKPTAYGYIQRGVVAAQQEDYASAKANFSRAIELQPKDYFGYVGRGLMEFGFGNSDAAIADLTQAASLSPGASPSRPIITMTQGLAYLGVGQYSQAIAAGNEAINGFIPGKTPAAILPQSYLLRSLAQSNNGNLPGAIADMTQLIQLQPKNAIAFQNRGEYYLRSQDPQRAILDFNQAIALDPGSAEAYQSRGQAYQQLQQFTAAQGDLNKAIALLTATINQQPNQVSTASLYIRRAQAHLGLQNLAGAKQDVLSAEKLFTSRGIRTGVLYDTIQKLKGLLAQIGGSSF